MEVECDELLRRCATGEWDFHDANLRGANLDNTFLDPAAPVPHLTEEQLRAAGWEIVGDEAIGWRTRRSHWCGSTDYAPGTTHEAPWFSVDITTECHPGLYLFPTRAAAPWREMIHAGPPLPEGKWRAKRLRVLEREREGDHTTARGGTVACQENTGL